MSPPVLAGDVAAVLIAGLWHHAEPVTVTCLHHPARPGVHLMPDGTRRCDPCHEDPRVVVWTLAGRDSTCACGNPIAAVDTVAVLDTPDHELACSECIESD